MTGTDFSSLLDSIDRFKNIIDDQETYIAKLHNTEITLLSLLADIRKAAGDPEGKLMQDELVARIAALKAGNEAAMALVAKWINKSNKAGQRSEYRSGSSFSYDACANQLEQALGKGESGG